MKLLIVRHAPAEDRGVFAATGQPDDLRPLTDAGRRRMRRVARGIANIVTPDLIATSPLTRAVQTAGILARACGVEVGETVDALRPDRTPDEFINWARATSAGATIAVVGHEPHLGTLTAWLLTGSTSEFVELKKGGACLLQFDHAPRKAGGMLLWLMRPSQLERPAR